MGNLFAELKRRHVYRVAAAYAVVAWVLLQFTANVAPILDLPLWIPRTFLLLLLVGFPVVLIFAWVHQMAPGDTGAAPSKLATGKLDWFLASAVVLMLGLTAYQVSLSQGTGNTQQPAGVDTVPGAIASPTRAISLAVLPFTNLSSDAEQEFFSDGITEEITAALAKVPGLRVVGRTSAFQFKGQSQDLRAIGQALSATHLLEGSVRKAGDRVRITAQLIKSDDGTHLWTENYDRQLTDIFATQENIAQAIAGALKVPLGLQLGDTLVRNRTNDLDSYQQYLHARALFRARAVGDAISLLELVVARDAGFAPAWALLADAYTILPDYSPASRSSSIDEARGIVQSSLDKAETAARKAIQLDSRIAGGDGALGEIQKLRGKLVAAEDLVRQALALDPNDPDMLHRYSLTLAYAGRLKDSLAMRETLQTLEPFVPIYNVFTAMVLQLNGQNAASIPILEAIPSDAAAGFNRNLYLARAYAAAGRYAEAADTLLLIKGNQVSRKSVEDAARLLRSAPAKAAEPLPELEGTLNFVYAYVGAPSRVMEFAERVQKIGYSSSTVADSLWSNYSAPLRKTERFKTYVRAAGLVDYWRARGWPDLCRPMGAEDFVCD